MVTAGSLPSVKRIREMFDYDPNTGIVKWKTGRRAGKPVGSKNSSGYLQAQFTIDGQTYRPLVHIIAWALHSGEWPPCQVDHTNHKRDDNRLTNLRLTSPAENMRNLGRRRRNGSKVAGIYFHKKTNKWRAQIRVDGKMDHLGAFDTEEEAIRARKAAEIAHGYHPNHGADTASGEKPLFRDRIEVWGE